MQSRNGNHLADLKACETWRKEKEIIIIEDSQNRSTQNHCNYLLYPCLLLYACSSRMQAIIALYIFLPYVLSVSSILANLLSRLQAISPSIYTVDVKFSKLSFLFICPWNCNCLFLVVSVESRWKVSLDNEELLAYGKVNIMLQLTTHFFLSNHIFSQSFRLSKLKPSELSTHWIEVYYKMYINVFGSTSNQYRICLKTNHKRKCLQHLPDMKISRSVLIDPRFQIRNHRSF